MQAAGKPHQEGNTVRVQLKHRETLSSAEAILCIMKSEHLCKAQASWTSELERRSRSGIQNEDLLLWQRGFLSQAVIEGGQVPAGHVLLCHDRVEGIVVIAAEPQLSWAMPTMCMTYVRYLATAPWNREGSNPETGFLGIGRLACCAELRDVHRHRRLVVSARTEFGRSDADHSRRIAGVADNSACVVPRCRRGVCTSPGSLLRGFRAMTFVCPVSCGEGLHFFRSK